MGAVSAVLAGSRDRISLGLSQATLKADCVNKPFAQRCHDLETVIEELPAKVSSLGFQNLAAWQVSGELVFYTTVFFVPLCLIKTSCLERASWRCSGKGWMWLSVPWSAWHGGVWSLDGLDHLSSFPA